MAHNPIRLDLDDTLGKGLLSDVTFAQATTIPDSVMKMMPSQAQAIPLFLDVTIQSPSSSGQGLPKAHIVATNNITSWSVLRLQKAPIPPAEWVAELNSSLPTIWGSKNGFSSVQHPTSRSLILPPWAGKYWTGMIEAEREQRTWQRAVDWVLQRPSSPTRLSVTNLLAKTPWGMRLWPLSPAEPETYISRLTSFLSLDWLQETQLDLMAMALNARSQSKWWAAGCSLGVRLQTMPKTTKAAIEEDPTLIDAQQQVENRSATNFVFPVNIDNNHWLVMSVDLQKKAFSYGVFSLPAFSHVSGVTHC